MEPISHSHSQIILPYLFEEYVDSATWINSETKKRGTVKQKVRRGLENICLWPGAQNPTKHDIAIFDESLHLRFVDLVTEKVIKEIPGCSEKLACSDMKLSQTPTLRWWHDMKIYGNKLWFIDDHHNVNSAHIACPQATLFCLDLHLHAFSAKDVTQWTIPHDTSTTSTVRNFYLAPPFLCRQTVGNQEVSLWDLPINSIAPSELTKPLVTFRSYEHVHNLYVDGRFLYFVVGIEGLMTSYTSRKCQLNRYPISEIQSGQAIIQDTQEITSVPDIICNGLRFHLSYLDLVNGQSRSLLVHVWC